MSALDLEKQPLLPKIEIKQKCGVFQKRKKLKQLTQYYGHLQQLVEEYKNDGLLTEKHEIRKRRLTTFQEGIAKQKIDKYLTIVIFIFNLVMLFGNLAASIISGSYSILSAFVDALMDIISSIIIYCAIHAINHTDRGKYPRGRERLETVSLVICSAIMSTANIFVVFESVQAILSDEINPEANLVTIGIMGVRILGKLIIMCICLKQNTPNSKVLAIDQRNDVITSIVALAGAYLGDYVWLYFDPLGAIIVSIYISIVWFVNAASYVPLIAGKRASQDEMSRILYMAIKHDPLISKIDYIAGYHLGEREIIELHIVLPEDCPLRISHDIVQGLQTKIVALDFVDLAFVHADYRIDGGQ